MRRRPTFDAAGWPGGTTGAFPSRTSVRSHVRPSPRLSEKVGFRTEYTVVVWIPWDVPSGTFMLVCRPRASYPKIVGFITLGGTSVVVGALLKLGGVWLRTRPRTSNSTWPLTVMPVSTV